MVVVFAGLVKRPGRDRAEALDRWDEHLSKVVV
jgi:hypothetical protein